MPEVRKVETPALTLAEIDKRLRDVEAVAARAPDQPIPWELADQYKALTSGTFIPTHHLELPHYDGAVLNVRFVVLCDPSTTAEVRIRQEISGAITDVAAVPAGTHYVDFEWLHGVHLGDTYEHFIIETRRASGAGTVFAYYPRRSLISTELRFPDATDTGNPFVI